MISAGRMVQDRMISAGRMVREWGRGFNPGGRVGSVPVGGVGGYGGRPRLDSGGGLVQGGL